MFAPTPRATDPEVAFPSLRCGLPSFKLLSHPGLVPDKCDSAFCTALFKHGARTSLTEDLSRSSAIVGKKTRLPRTGWRRESRYYRCPMSDLPAYSVHAIPTASDETYLPFSQSPLRRSPASHYTHSFSFSFAKLRGVNTCIDRNHNVFETCLCKNVKKKRYLHILLLRNACCWLLPNVIVVRVGKQTGPTYQPASVFHIIRRSSLINAIKNNAPP